MSRAAAARGGLLRDQFALPDAAYFVGNSLGALPRRTASRSQEVMQEWGSLLISGWNEASWTELDRAVAARLAPVVGCDGDELAVGDSTSVNLYKVLSAALAGTKRRTIVVEPTTFPTDGYIAQGVARTFDAQVRWCDPRDPLSSVDDDTAVLLLSQVDFRTGARYDLPSLTTSAQERGAWVAWDLCHSAGALPIDLDRHGVDFAVGCTYKYLNGGPGAPGYAFVNRRHHGVLAQPLTGWWGHAEPFAMRRDYTPASGMTQFAVGTPSILGLSLLEASLSLFQDVDLAALHADAVALGDALIDGVLASTGLEVLTPRAAGERGSQVSFRHDRAAAICAALKSHGVWADVRSPDVLRFGIAPLYVNAEDVARATSALAQVWSTLDHLEDPPPAPKPRRIHVT